MARGFYRQLALGNLQKNKSHYLPYLLTGICTVAMFYMIHAIANNPGLREMPGSETLILMMNFGSWVIGIFALIFLFYTNSFLMKRRKKELGLYNILGMEKRHLAKMLTWETAFIAIGSLVLGLSFGIVLSKLLFLILLKMSGLEVPLVFGIPVISLKLTISLFLVIYLLTLLTNYTQLQVATPIALLQSGNQGEKEPKTRIVLTIIGMMALLSGYLMAQLVEGAAAMLLGFFPAVLLVMLGTYLLFIAGSIAVLKLLRRKKSYYYQPAHFITVSGMLYRMKQNAVGLANICILSAAVLLSVSTTVSLYIGMEDILRSRFAFDLSITVPETLLDTEGTDTDLQAVAEQAARAQGLTIEYSEAQQQLTLRMEKHGNIFDTSISSSIDFAQLYLMTVQDYNRLTEQTLTLEATEVLYHNPSGEALDEVELLGHHFLVQENLSDYPVVARNNLPGTTSYYLVVADAVVLQQLAQEQESLLPIASTGIRQKVDLRFAAGNDAGEIACADALRAQFERISIESRASQQVSLKAFYGGFLFLGMFLGTLFLMATTLIIYYKQISEGYEDQSRFEIMQKVGLSQQEVQRTIRSQVRLVFFLPLVTAGIHILFCFHIVSGILSQGFGLQNYTLMVICNLLTFLLFALVYGLIYRFTARSYYRIVTKMEKSDAVWGSLR